MGLIKKFNDWRKLRNDRVKWEFEHGEKPKEFTPYQTEIYRSGRQVGYFFGAIIGAIFTLLIVDDVGLHLYDRFFSFIVNVIFYIPEKVFSLFS